MLERVVSGGQTGVDRAALDVALRLDIPAAGWCPRGRLAEDGRIGPGYPLVETETSEYAERTRLNVRDSDGTLILAWGEMTGGTALTRVFALQLGKPHLVVDLAAGPSVAESLAWIKAHGVRVLNVAGPRASTVPGIYTLAANYLETLFREDRAAAVEGESGH
jgi:hypothetical protein